MSADFGKVKEPQRERVLALLSDLAWHSWSELAEIASRFSARLHELKRLGYRIENRPVPAGGEGDGYEYRLTSTTPDEVTPVKRVKVYLDEDDAAALLKGRVTQTASRALEDALRSYRANASKL